MKVVKDSESYVCMKAYSQVQLFTYEPINTYEYAETFRLHFDLAYCIKYMNPACSCKFDDYNGLYQQNCLLTVTNRYN